jgi:hypothetical protein
VKSRRQVFLLLLWCLLASAVPAYANNPPQPDGVLTLVLIFPVVILGFRLAGVKLSEKERKWRVLRGLLLALCTLLTFGGTGLALIPLLVLLGYGAARGIQVMARGQGATRKVLGGVVILFTLFAVANYVASLSYPPEGRSTEHAAYVNLRVINVAEQRFHTEGVIDANKNGLGEYGSLEDLHKAGLLDEAFWARLQRPIYRYVVVLSGDPVRDEKQYLVYASPVHYGHPWRGLSLLRVVRPYVPYARRTFACDQTGVVRAADLGGSRAVTRDEAAKWPEY